MSLLIADNGMVRLVFPNLHQIADGVWRGGQPTPGQLRAFARRGGRSVVSLRAGRGFGSLPLEIDACREAGLLRTEGNEYVVQDGDVIEFLINV